MTAATLRPTWSWPRLGGLTWLTWRQHRLALLGAVAVLGAFTVFLVVNGAAMHSDFHRLGLDTCGGLAGRTCRQGAVDVFRHRFESVAQFMPHVMLFIPALLGAFVGAPLIARELETGTFRFAWTQGTNRRTWAVAKLALLGAALVVLSLAFSAIVTWWFRPWIPQLGRMISGGAYEVEGTVFAARTLFGFALGALLGAVIRRTVPAIAATLALWVGVAWSSLIYLRPLIQKPVVAPAESARVSGNGWTISDWFQDKTGHHLSDSEVNALLGQPPILRPGERKPSIESVDQLLASHGVHHWVSYQPGSRFWHFQLVETSAYVLLAVLLAAATVAWVRRRAA